MDKRTSTAGGVEKGERVEVETEVPQDLDTMRCLMPVVHVTSKASTRPTYKARLTFIVPFSF